MTKSTVFTINKSQAVRLPKPVALPENVKQVEITKIGRSRLISPVGHSWDAFFDAGGTGDLRGREQPKPQKREPL
ncbi:MAG TPA: type II toxin-antitoxin system VapB family antitoxin [Dongiaceae bacterium]|jgi:antitoxin VapB|nr:type II toxin-antitoxin system VapB family antitoxin [Dongiaceae bacterium]